MSRVQTRSMRPPNGSEVHSEVMKSAAREPSVEEHQPQHRRTEQQPRLADGGADAGNPCAGHRTGSALDLCPGLGPVLVGRARRRRCGRPGTARSAWSSSGSARRRPRPPRGRSRRTPLRRCRTPCVARRLAEPLGHRGVGLGADDVVEPGVGAVGCLGRRADHPGVGPAGGPLPRAGSPRPATFSACGEVDDHLPGGADHRVAGVEGLDLLEVVGPVLADVLALLLEQVDGGRELVLVEGCRGSRCPGRAVRPSGRGPRRRCRSASRTPSPGRCRRRRRRPRSSSSGPG